MCDEKDSCIVLNYGSSKSKWAVRLIMGDELFAIVKAFDMMITIAADLTRIFDQRISVCTFTVSKKVFDLTTCGNVH